MVLYIIHQGWPHCSCSIYVIYMNVRDCRWLQVCTRVQVITGVYTRTGDYRCVHVNKSELNICFLIVCNFLSICFFQIVVLFWCLLFLNHIAGAVNNDRPPTRSGLKAPDSSIFDTGVLCRRDCSNYRCAMAMWLMQRSVRWGILRRCGVVDSRLAFGSIGYRFIC